MLDYFNTTTSESMTSLDLLSVEVAMSQGKTDVSSDGEQSDQSQVKPVRIEWTGTSDFLLQEVIDLQVEGFLDQLIIYRKALIHDIAITPYDPTFYLDLARLDCKLGFTDIGVGNAHKALILTEEALNASIKTTNSGLKASVRLAITTRLHTDSAIIIKAEMELLNVDAYRWLLTGLLGCAASWDCLLLAKKALQKYPKDVELLDLRQTAKASFEERHAGLVATGTRPADVVALSQTGRIYQRQYPWLDQSLHIRTPAFLQKINKDFSSWSCEVRPVTFGTSTHTTSDTEIVKENTDVGPLGVFATRDIEYDEIILIDNSNIGISDIPPSSLQYCDACHTALIPPYFIPSNIVYPKCCSAAVFCSKSCHDTAINGYHSILCGEDFDWLYSNPGTKGTYGVGTKWIPVMFLRIVAIVLADFAKDSSYFKNQHILQHPLVASLAANYSASSVLPKVGHTWQYNENIVLPMSILQQLRIDIFSHPNWAPEVIQTLIWRIDNNANMCSTTLWSSGSDTVGKVAKVNMVSINSKYVFLNHSCDPNVSWHGTVENSDMGISWLEVGDGKNGKKEMLKPGESTVVCRAARKIQRGEELCISYVGDPLGMEEGEGMSGEGREMKRFWLNKWFEGGCGCIVCKGEDEMGVEGVEGSR